MHLVQHTVQPVNNNTNNSSMNIFIVLSSSAKQYSRVHSVHI